MGLKAKLLYDLGLIRLRYHMKQKKLIEPLYEKEGTLSKNPAMVVYMLDGRWAMGGLGDCLHGIISLYIFCKRTALNSKQIFVILLCCMIILNQMSMIGESNQKT